MAKTWRVVQEIYEEGESEPTLTHVFYGSTRESAWGIYRAHMKTDAFMRSCVVRRQFADFQCHAVDRTEQLVDGRWLLVPQMGARDRVRFFSQKKNRWLTEAEESAYLSGMKPDGGDVLIYYLRDGLGEDHPPAREEVVAEVAALLRDRQAELRRRARRPPTPRRGKRRGS